MKRDGKLVLIVSENYRLLTSIQELFSGDGDFQVHVVSDPSEAMVMIMQCEYAMIVASYDMYLAGGKRFVSALRGKECECCVVVANANDVVDEDTKARFHHVLNADQILKSLKPLLANLSDRVECMPVKSMFGRTKKFVLSNDERWVVVDSDLIKYIRNRGFFAEVVFRSGRVQLNKPIDYLATIFNTNGLFELSKSLWINPDEVTSFKMIDMNTSELRFTEATSIMLDDAETHKMLALIIELTHVK